jgi:hypothetical protein
MTKEHPLSLHTITSTEIYDSLIASFKNASYKIDLTSMSIVFVVRLDTIDDDSVNSRG